MCVKILKKSVNRKLPSPQSPTSPWGSQHTKPNEEDHQLQVVANSTMKATNKDRQIPIVAAWSKAGRGTDGKLRMILV